MRKRLLWITAVLSLLAPIGALGQRVVEARRSDGVMRDALALLDAPLTTSPTPESLDCARAEGLLERVRSARGDDPVGRHAVALKHVTRACLDMARGEMVLAANESDTAYRLAPDDARTAMWQGLLAARRGDAARAERMLTMAEGAHDAPAAVKARASMTLVDVLLDGGRAHDALPRAEALARELPASDAVALRVGLCRSAVGDAAGAQQAFERAAELAPTHAEPWVNLARLSRTRGDVATAQRQLERAVAVDPQSGEAWLAYGIVLSDVHDARARETLRRAQGLMRDKPGPWVAEGNLDLAAGEYAAAAAHFREALTRAESDGMARANLGVALARMGDRQGALTAFEEATRDAPELGAAWNGVGAMWLSMDQPARAVGPLQQASVLLPDDPNPSLNLGLALERLQRWTEAARAFRETLRRSPGNDVATRHLAQLQPG